MHSVVLKGIAKVPSQKVARQPKCFSFFFFFRQASSNLLDSSTMLFAQNSSIFFSLSSAPAHVIVTLFSTFVATFDLLWFRRGLHPSSRSLVDSVLGLWPDPSCFLYQLWCIAEVLLVLCSGTCHSQPNGLPQGQSSHYKGNCLSLPATECARFTIMTTCRLVTDIYTPERNAVTNYRTRSRSVIVTVYITTWRFSNHRSCNTFKFLFTRTIYTGIPRRTKASSIPLTQVRVICWVERCTAWKKGWKCGNNKKTIDRERRETKWRKNQAIEILENEFR